jgi:hypothetical protein
MSRIVRQFLFATLIACHAAVVLCGPCLHGLSGSEHEMGAASNPNRAGHPLQSGTDSKDGCLICHFLAQGQLPVEFSRGSSPQLIAEHVIPALPPSDTVPDQLTSCPRAPPIVFLGLS